MSVMKTVVFCGGKGTRLGSSGLTLPKGLFDIGGRPILWHLIKMYAQYGMTDIILCLGHLGDMISDYFTRNPIAGSNITFANTGAETNTGGRLFAVRELLGKDLEFCVTYGDGLSNIDLTAEIAYHRSHGKVATLAAVHPRCNFGIIKLNQDSCVTAFEEKPVMSDWINGGFFVFNAQIFDYLNGDVVLEREPFEKLATAGQLAAFQHFGFWKCMDTYKENLEFNQLWENGNAPWKVWND